MFCGVDVGSESVRAAIFDDQGRVLGSHSLPITVWNAEPNHFEQSSAEIWLATCGSIRKALEVSNIDKSCVKAIGFDATCSLVLLDKENRPLTVSRSGSDANLNVIMWMDHRAIEEADFINSTRHRILDGVGGSISPEMQLPKLLWLKKNKPAIWNLCGSIFDLADYLTFMATGDSEWRCSCSLVCKWCYSKSNNWKEFLSAVGLEEVLNKVGSKLAEPGTRVGSLSHVAAHLCGLMEGTAVAAGVIDAYSGALGTLGLSPRSTHSELSNIVEGSLSIVAGTSACHIISGKTPQYINGVWGPYDSVLIPGYWTLEAGQTAAGKLLDFMVETHPAYGEALQCFKDTETSSIYAALNHQAVLFSKSQNLEQVDYLASNLHILPDFHGNRSPIADPLMQGMICGLDLDIGLGNLVKVYISTLFSLAYGTRHIIDVIRGKGVIVNKICMSGGLINNPLFVQAHANITGLSVHLPSHEHSVLLGSAMYAKACISDGISSSLMSMCQAGRVVRPFQDKKLAVFHERKYNIFLEMIKDQLKYRKMFSDPI